MCVDAVIVLVGGERERERTSGHKLMMAGVYLRLLLLWVASSAHITTGKVTLQQGQVEVMEDRGKVRVCLSSDRQLCLTVTTEAGSAEEGEDYTGVSNTLLVNSHQSVCESVQIRNDDKPESEESFLLHFVEKELNSPECPAMAANGSDLNMGSGSGDGDIAATNSTDDGMMIPMFEESVTIVIKDDDFFIAVVTAAIAGFIVILLFFMAIIFICYRRRRRRRRRKAMGHSSVDHSYMEFNSHAVRTDRQYMDGEEHSTKLIHTAIADVPLSKFAGYVKELHRDADRGFSQQYSALQAHSASALPCKAAELSANQVKNRYPNILPYDNTRVLLNDVGKNSDYINANWINGYKREKTYVACQGPLMETIPDFWRMVWELRIPSIIMLTRTVEASRPKCEQYWPSGVEESISLSGGMSVQLLEVVPFADYEMRKLVISHGSENRKVTHYYFQAWPDHGVPRYATALLGFIRLVRKHHFPSDPAPLLVHCSAGVGRTGTLIVLDILLQAIEAEIPLNVYECVMKLRAQRCFMVQSEAQYIFIHDALEELITCGKTEISAGNLRIAMNRLSATIPGKDITGFQQQFRLVEQVSRQPMNKDLEICRKPFNWGKNRYPKILPYDFQHVSLRVTGQQGSDYINASWVNGYRQNNAFMTTQGSLENTVEDLWRMVWEMNSHTIVMLCGLREDNEEVCVRYWPEQEQQEMYGSLRVRHKSEEQLNKAVSCRVFEVSRQVSAAAPGQEASSVTQFQFHGWPQDRLPSDPSLLLELLNRVLKNQMSTGNKPITVMCSDGSGRSGVFVVLYSQLERLKTEHVVDVFQGIKAARIQRMGIVHSAEAYKFIHELLIEYLSSFTENNYDNFKYN